MVESAENEPIVGWMRICRPLRKGGDSMSKKRIYIAGPMSKGDKVDNLAQALKAFRILMEKGFAPLCPQLTFFAEPFMNHFSWDNWLGIDLPFVEVCHAVIRLPGESKGADLEVLHANKHNVPVYHNLSRLIEELGV